MPRITSYRLNLGFFGIIALGLIFTGAYFSAADHTLLTYYTKEDGFLEWLTFLVFVASFLLMLFLWIRQVFMNGHSAFKMSSIVLLGFSAMFFLAAMEEVSWFQRVFGVESSEMFKEMNKQGETNFHNMVVGGVSINKLIFGKILFLFVFAHNLVFPIWAKFNANIYKRVEKLGLFLPPLGFVSFYLFAAILVEVAIDHERAKEVLETTGSLHYMFSFFSVYFLGRNGYNSVIKDDKAKTMASILFCMLIALLMVMALVMGSISLS